MANKKLNQLVTKSSIATGDLFPIADATTGQLYKTTISDLGTAIGSGVSSVNTLVGAVVLDTDDIQELASPANKWFTDLRARGAISGGTGISYNSGTGVITNTITQYTDALARSAVSLTTTGANGSATYNSTTGVLNVPAYTLSGLGGQPLAGNLTALAGLQFSNLGFIKMTGVGTLALDTNTYALTSQLHNAVTIGTANGLSLSTQVLSLSLASSTTNGALSSTDWNTFNNKQSALTFSGPLTLSGSTVYILTASSAQNGYLSATDWSTFNGKANDADVVKLTGNQTIAGVKTFSNRIIVDTDLVTNNVMFLKNANSNGYGLSIQAGFGTNYALYVANNVGAKAFEVLASGVTNILGTVTIGNFDGLALKMQAGTSTGNSYLRFYNSAGATRGYFGLFNNAGTDYMLLDGSSVDTTINGNANLYLQTGGNNRLTINSSGNVGIGTTSPLGILHTLVGSATNNYFYQETTTTNVWSGNLLRYNGTDYMGSIGNISTGEYKIGGFNNTGYFITLYTNNAERVRITPSGNVGIGTTAPERQLHVLNSAKIEAGIYFNNTLSGSGAFLWQEANESMRFGTNNTERMRITSGGAVLIGASSTGNSERFNVTQSGVNWAMAINHTNSAQFFIDFRSSGTQTGSITAGGGVTNYNVTSDYRLKEDLKSINGLDLINKINIYDYKYKSSGMRIDGVLAHELAEVLPYAVSGVKDGEQMQQVDYSKIVPVMVQAIKDLKVELDTLKNK